MTLLHARSDLSNVARDHNTATATHWVVRRYVTPQKPLVTNPASKKKGGQPPAAATKHYYTSREQ